MSFNVISFLKSALANRGATPVADDNPLPVIPTIGSTAVSSSAPLPALTFSKLINYAASAMTRPANTTPYSANDLVANSGTAGSVTATTFVVADVIDMPFRLTHCEIQTADTGPATATAQFELWLFNSDPAANSGIVNGDNAAFSVNRAGFIGRLSGTFIANADGSSAILVPTEGPFLQGKPKLGDNLIYGLLKTLTAFTSSANSTAFTMTMRGEVGRA